MQTALQEKDTVIAQLRRELTDWPGHNLTISPAARSFAPPFSSTHYELGSSKGTEVPASASNSSISVPWGGASESRAAFDIVGRKKQTSDSGRKSGEDGLGRLSAPVYAVETHEADVRSSSEFQPQAENGWMKADRALLSEGDRAGTNPLSFSPHTKSSGCVVSSEDIFDGGFGDRGTASLSRRLQSLTETVVDSGPLGTQWERFAQKSHAELTSSRFVSSPQGVRSYGTPEARVSRYSQYFDHADEVTGDQVSSVETNVAEDIHPSDLGMNQQVEDKESKREDHMPKPGSEDVRPITAHPTKGKHRHEEDTRALEHGSSASLRSHGEVEGPILTSRSSESTSSVRRRQATTPIGKVLFSDRKRVASPATNSSSSADVAGISKKKVALDGASQVGHVGSSSSASVPRKLRSTVIASRADQGPTDADPYETETDFESTRRMNNHYQKPKGSAAVRPTTARLSAGRRRGERNQGHMADYQLHREAFEDELFRLLPGPLTEDSD